MSDVDYDVVDGRQTARGATTFDDMSEVEELAINNQACDVNDDHMQSAAPEDDFENQFCS